MTYPPCREGTLEETLNHPGHWEYSTYGHEWPEAPEPEAMRVVKVAHGNSLPEGDKVTLVKDPKLGGGSQVLKAGTKAKIFASWTAITCQPVRSRADRWH